MKVIFPGPNMNFVAGDGTKWLSDANCVCDISSHSPLDFFAVGCIPETGQVGTTAQRPTTGLYPGLRYMDTTLAAAGKPIYRNATNTGWVDATGTAA
jgi:hypothetical protein